MIGPNPFNIWGWPWHGLCTGGSITPSGKTITQPAHGNAWLIDLGLPAISLTSAETTEATANDYTWLNYAMISGGQVYGTYLGAETFIHVDAAQQCWLIALAYSYPAANTLRVTATLQRFGHFGQGVATSIEKTVDIVCEAIDTGSYDTGTYSGRLAILQDVATNGQTALIGIRMLAYPIADLFSVVEISLSGTGGATGSGITLSGTELRPKSQLTYAHVNEGAYNTHPDDPDPVVIYAATTYDYTWELGPNNYDLCAENPTGVQQISTAVPGSGLNYWKPTGTGYTGGQDVIVGRDIQYSYARYAYYDSAGNPQCMRLLIKDQQDHYAIAGGYHNVGGGIKKMCNTNYWEDDGFYANWRMYIEGYVLHGVYLVANDTVIDQMAWRQNFSHTQWAEAVWYDSTVFTNTDQTLHPPTWTGSLSAHYDADINEFDASAFSMLTNWRSNSTIMDGTLELTGPALIGLQNMDAKAVGFYAPSGATKIFEAVATPLGLLATSITPTGYLYFAWQRKTDAYAFAEQPICYV